MTVHFTRDRLILYLSLAIGYIIHWTHNDMALSPGGITIKLMNNVWQVIFIVGLNLLYFEYILPFVTSGIANRFLFIVSSIVIHLVALATGLYAWRVLGKSINIYQPFNNFSDASTALYDCAGFVLGSFLVFAVVKLFFDYTELKYDGQRAKLEKKQAELIFLKAQINPHFLFNTLNNIYSLSQHEPKLASESILRLSQILRYMLYETDSEFITVDKEIKILTDYIDLEKLRYNESVTIDFKYDIENFSEMIPPLLLIPLIENAFKHGVSESRGERFINIEFILKKQKLYFVVKNSSDAVGNNHKTSGNIGLPNLRRRLNLLYNGYYGQCLPAFQY